MPRRLSTILALGAVGITVFGMVIGAGLLLLTAFRSVGWLLFILSFGGWLAAALFGMREGWYRGWFDR